MGMDGGDFLRVRGVGAQRLQVPEEAGTAVGDLPTHLGLVHELGLQDALDGAGGLGLDRGPGLAPREVGPEVRPRGGGGRGAAGEGARDGEQRPEGPHHGARNSRTPRRKASS